MGEVCGYVFEAPGEKCLYLAADTIYCTEVEQTIRKYYPEAGILRLDILNALLAQYLETPAHLHYRHGIEVFFLCHCLCQ